MIHSTEKEVPLTGGRVTVDFDRDAYARLEVETDLDAPARLEIAIGEVCNPDGSLHRAPGGFRTIRTMTRDCPAGRSSFAFPIAPHRSPYWHTVSVRVPPEAGGEVVPFRYVEIDGGSGRAKLIRRELYGDFDDDAADFRSSDETLDRIWDLCKYTMKATGAFGIYIDGERERKPYEGDAFLNMLGDLCCGGSPETAFATLIWLFQFPTYPTEWQLLAPFLLRDYLLYTGRRDNVEKLLTLLEPNFRSLLAGADEDLLLRDGAPPGDQRTSGRGRRDIVDWPVSERDDYDFGEVNLVPNCYWHGALKVMRQLTGKPDYAVQAEKLRQTILRRMYRPRRGLFVDNPQSEHTSLHSAFFPICFGLTDRLDPEPLKQCIRSKGMVCSVYAAHFLIESCFICGMDDFAMRLITGDGLRSYRNMLRKGATITMEAWDDSLKPNQDWTHAWGAAPANLIPRWVGGIRPLTPGFQTFLIDPHPADLEFFTLRHPTPHGPVELEWHPDRFRVTVPKGTTGFYRGSMLPPGSHELRRTALE